MDQTTPSGVARPFLLRDMCYTNLIVLRMVCEFLFFYLCPGALTAPKDSMKGPMARFPRICRFVDFINKGSTFISVILRPRKMLRVADIVTTVITKDRNKI